MAFDSGSVLSFSDGSAVVSAGFLLVDLSAINTALPGTDLDIDNITTLNKKGTALKALLDYLVLDSPTDTYQSDNTYPITASDAEYDTNPTYVARGESSYQYKSYTLQCYSGSTAPTQNFDPDDMAY